MEYTKRLELKSIQSEFPKEQITSSDQAQKFIKRFYQDDLTIYESFYILLLDRNNQTIGYAKISQGGVAGTVVDPKIVAQYAVDSLSSAVILAHNHPSGNKKPSQSDIALTKKVRDGLKLLDIATLDHVILTEEGYTSLADEGLM